MCFLSVKKENQISSEKSFYFQLKKKKKGTECL